MGAWGLVHLLHNGPPAFRKRYGALADLVRSGRPFRVAWQATFGDVSSREFEAAFRSHLSQARVPLLALPYTPPPAPSAPRVRAMTGAEAHLLWARLRSWEADAAGKASGDLAEARAEDAGSPEVRYWQALYALRVTRDRSLAARLLEEALSARPSEPRYLLALALALDEDDGAPRGSARLAGVVEHLARRAASAMQLEFLARHHARREHLDAARSFAERSVKADPTCAACLDTYAMVSFAKGDLAEAVYAEERAIAALPEQHVDRDMVARLEKYVQAYEAREKQGG
jgi:tetratricopeptide (TPR) repeat protein